MTDRERAIKYRKEAGRYKRKYIELRQTVENIKTDLKWFAEHDAYGDYQQSIANGCKTAIDIIDKHMEVSK